MASTEIEGVLVLMDGDTGNYFRLGGTAKRIWEELEQSRTIEKLCGALVESYDVDATTCRRDLEDFVDSLVEQQLVLTGR